MIIRLITELGLQQRKLLAPSTVLACTNVYGTKVCPGKGTIAKGPVCPPTKTGGGGTAAVGDLKRPERGGKVRLGLIPDEWFLFFRSKTGVSGPYLLLLGLGNYAASKEILVMEHEYYSGLSVALVLYIISTRFGKQIGAALDQEVDAVHASFQKGRTDEIQTHKETIKQSMSAQVMAKAQKELMDAKKENIALQLEAIYRERLMMVYTAVRNRMEYHVKRASAQTRIEQKWMLQWILKKVHEGITPEFQKEALRSAIRDIASITPK